MTQPLSIGPYEAGEFVARDAHASVCRVIDPDDGRTLTAKLYAPTGGPDTRLLSRWHEEFADEVRRLRRHGDDLVPIEATGRAGDMAWVVMDIPAGEFLEAVLGDRPLPLDRTRALLGGMAAALDRLHVAGLVHRSLKPSNVFLAEDGSVLFLDTLLLGRFAEAVVAGALSLERVTCAAPEVVLGYRQRAASNQYSLAVLAYRSLTGAWPYAAGNAIDYAYACVYQEAPAPSSRQAGISPAADAVMARAMAKEPDDRYATCTDFVDALDAALRECEHPSEPAPAKPGLQDQLPDEGRDEVPALEWFRPATKVLELVPEPPADPPTPLRAVRDPDPLPTPAPEDATPDPVEATPNPVEATPDALEAQPDPAVDVVAAAAADLDEVELETDARPAPPEVVVPDPQEFDEFVAAPRKHAPRPSARRRLHELGTAVTSLVGKFTARARGRRVPDHLMREAYLADWRGDAARSSSGDQDWSDPITPEWTLTVQPVTPGWLRVDGRYAGPAPAEISILGRSGKRVLVELMRDGVAVATTELKLHPLMDKTWEPQELA